MGFLYDLSQWKIRLDRIYIYILYFEAVIVILPANHLSLLSLDCSLTLGKVKVNNLIAEIGSVIQAVRFGPGISAIVSEPHGSSIYTLSMIPMFYGRPINT